MKRKVVILSIAAICLLLAVTPCAAQVPPNVQGLKMYLQIDGIKGESQEDKHKDWIEVFHYAGGVSQGYDPAWSGTSTQPNFAPVTVFKYIDLSSPKLREGAAYGQHFRSAQFEMAFNGFTFFTVRMENVMISNAQALTPEIACPTSSSSTDSNYPQERVSFTFGKITYAWLWGQNNITTGYDFANPYLAIPY